MMKYPVYNQEGEIVKETELPSEIFGLKINPDLLWQVVRAQLSNQRSNSAKVKDRSEVSYSGRKIWPQKGLGRARHGDVGAPIFRKGGVAHGPSPKRNFKQKIPKKMKKKAILMALSSKAKDKELILIDQLKIDKPKTKIMVNILQNLKEKIENFKKGSVLVVLPKDDKNVKLSARNIKKVKVIQANNLNCLDLLNFKFLLMPERAIEVIKNTFLK